MTLWQVEEAYFAAVRAYMAAMNWPPPVYAASHTGPEVKCPDMRSPMTLRNEKGRGR